MQSYTLLGGYILLVQVHNIGLILHPKILQKTVSPSADCATRRYTARTGIAKQEKEPGESTLPNTSDKRQCPKR